MTDPTETAPSRAPRQLAILGTALVLLGMVTGAIGPQLVNPRMGLSSHLAAVSGGVLMLALAGVWHHVRLSPRGERWAVGLIGYANLANWLATFLAALWGAGRETMPIATGTHQAAAWQEAVVTALLATLSGAILIGLALVLKGLLKARQA